MKIIFEKYEIKLGGYDFNFFWFGVHTFIKTFYHNIYMRPVFRKLPKRDPTPKSVFSRRPLEKDPEPVVLDIYYSRKRHRASRFKRDEPTSFFTSERIMTVGTAFVAGMAMNSEVLKTQLGDNRWPLIAVFLAASAVLIIAPVP